MALQSHRHTDEGTGVQDNDYTMSLIRARLDTVHRCHLLDRSWRGADGDALRQNIVKSSLGRSLPSTATVDELFVMHDSTLRSIADQLAPERTVKCQLRPMCPWFDAECRAIRRNCRRL